VTRSVRVAQVPGFVPFPPLQPFLDGVSDRYELQPIPEREFQRDGFFGASADKRSV
jgi:hypothetical protein